MFPLVIALLWAGLAVAQNNTNTTSVSLTVASGSGNATSPLQYGIMFEDINHSGDGGLYAELIQNRAFQGAANVSPFYAVGGATLTLQNLSTPLSSALPQSLNVALSNSSINASGQVGFANPGYWGIYVAPQTYTGSFWVYGGYTGDFTASMINYLTNITYASATITGGSQFGRWTQHNYTLVPTEAAPNVNNSLEITFDSSAVNGSLNFDLISLFPPTYNDRPNGMRIDLMEALKGLSPSFLRMPGGNNLEGESSATGRWIWNNTIGPLIDRPGRLGDWGYWNTDGLGLVEFLYWCIDLDMEPVLAVWSGLYLDDEIIPKAEIDIYVQDALNELEFIMGSPDTTYGALRVSLGYGTAPIYTIKYVEVGNEDNLNSGGGSYESYRFTAFYNAIHAAYPDITVIASTVAYPSIIPTGADGDYHQYTRPDYFVSQFNFFDQNTSSSGHQILIGEYASVQPNEAGQLGVNWNEPRMPFPFWVGTVSEAIFLLGAERNADVILGASYAPLFQNLNSYEWAPDLISYTADPDQTILSTSYHMIQLFSNTRIATTLPVLSSPSTTFGPAYWVAGTASSSSTGSYILKAATYNSTTSTVPFSVTFPGIKSGASANLTVLTAANGPYSQNTLADSDEVVTTVTMLTAGTNGTFVFALDEYCIALLVVG